MARSDAGSKLSQLVRRGGECFEGRKCLGMIDREGRWVDLVGVRRFENRDSVKLWQVDGLIWRGPEVCALSCYASLLMSKGQRDGSRVLPSRWVEPLVSVTNVKSGGVKSRFPSK